MSKFLQQLFFIIIFVTIGIIIGTQINMKNDKQELSQDISDILMQARDSIDYELTHNGDFTQAHLTTASLYLNKIIKMELDWLELKICNHPNYGKFETVYQQERDDFDEKYKTAMNKPSEYEGGSLAPFDMNSRSYGLLEARLLKLNQLLDKMTKQTK